MFETKSLRNLPQEIDQWCETRCTQRYLGGICFNETGPLNHLYLDSTEFWIQGLYPVQCIYGGVPKRDQRQVGVDWIWILEIAGTKSLQRFAHCSAAAIIAVSCNPINRIGINCINHSNVVHCDSMYKVSMSCRPFLERVWTWRYVLRDDSRHNDRAVELADKAYVRLSDYSIKHPEKVTDDMKLD